MKTENRQSGFTLVESLVTVAISMIICGVINTMFSMYSSQTNDSIASLFMHQQYDNVAHQIASNVHRASFVLAEGESPAGHGSGYDTVSSIFLTNRAGTVLTRYTFNGGDLLEGTQQTQYSAGGTMVKVAAGASRFIIDPQRRQVQIEIVMNRVVSGKSYASSLRKDVFLCRN